MPVTGERRTCPAGESPPDRGGGLGFHGEVGGAVAREALVGDPAHRREKRVEEAGTVVEDDRPCVVPELPPRHDLEELVERPVSRRAGR